MARLRLCYSTTTEPLSHSANEGFGKALQIFGQLQDEGVPCKLADTSRASKEEVHKAYAKAWPDSVSKKYGIRRVFGTRRRSGCFFGREVPALLVFENNRERPVDVYPHEELGRTVTIRDYLQDLIPERD